MFTVQVEKTVACAHQLFGYNGPCEKLHGHNYRILVVYKGERLDQFGMLVDFSEVKKRFFSILDRLDHAYLNDLPEFKDVSPSAENIARLVYTELSASPFDLAKLDEVQVWETPTQMATYRE
jgi:6-pyruvoyltetrahydropterin/6-carboxytetrahydropterin synthase